MKRYSWVLILVTMLFIGVFINIHGVQALPTMFVDPATIRGDLTPAPDSVYTFRINVSSVPAPGLWGWQFRLNTTSNSGFPGPFANKIPLTNMNFTGNAAGWTTTYDDWGGFGTATSGYDAGNGNPGGSGVGSYFVKAASDGPHDAYFTFHTTQTFSWPGVAPPDGGALISLAFRITGTGISYVGIDLVANDPLANPNSLFGGASYFYGTQPWTYWHNITGGSAFQQSGTYNFELYADIGVNAGSGNNAQLNWDDTGLQLAPVQLIEGPMLKPQTPTLPISNMNFTANANGWTTTTAGTGTQVNGWDSTTGNLATGSYKDNVTATASEYANMNFTTSTTFTWDKGQPQDAYLSYAYRIEGNSFNRTEDDKLPNSNSNGGTPWTNPTYAYTSNDQYATAATDFATQDYYGYHINAPTDMTVTKVEVGYEGYKTNNVTMGIQVTWDNGAHWAIEQQVSLLGSDTDTTAWVDFTSAPGMAGWDSSKLSDTNFKVKVTAHIGTPAGIISLDALPVRVTYRSSFFDILLVKPDNTVISLISPFAFNATYPTKNVWTYKKGVVIGSSLFSTSGTYKLALVANLKTGAKGASNYIRFNWDDVGLKLQIQGGGPTFWVGKYTGSGQYFASVVIVATPYVTGWPVQGSGTIAYVKVLVGYGICDLKLYDTKLLSKGDPPGYPTIELAHTTANGLWDNRITGDANVDRTVNIFDIGAVKSRWGRTPASADWVREYDVNFDNVVNIFDIGIIKANWGRHYP